MTGKNVIADVLSALKCCSDELADAKTKQQKAMWAIDAKVAMMAAFTLINEQLVENEQLRRALRPLLAHWDDLETGESVSVDAARAAMGHDDIPDFTPGNGNKARRRAADAGIDYDAAMAEGNEKF